eukprot:g1172.t1
MFTRIIHRAALPFLLLLLLPLTAFALDMSEYLPAECGQSLDLDDFQHPTCVKKIVSKVLSIAIIAGAGILKVPQIVGIVRSKSIEGLAAESFYLEAISLTASVMYSWKQGYPLTTYGESIIINAQVFVLILLVWVYAKPKVLASRRVSLMVGYGLAVALMHSLPPNMRPVLLFAGTVLNISSRMPQIWINFRNKGTGQLSIITWSLNAAGGAARIFTTLTEVDDVFVMLGFVLGFTTSVVLVLQIVAYESGGGPTQSLRDGDSRAVSRNDAEDEECKNRTESNASVKDEKSSEAHAAKVIKQFSEQLLDVAKQLQNFDESDESDEYLKGYQKLIANAKVDWKALGRDFDDILDEREENESDAEERKKAANDARKAAEKAALEKVRAGLPKKTELAKTNNFNCSALTKIGTFVATSSVDGKVHEFADVFGELGAPATVDAAGMFIGADVTGVVATIFTFVASSIFGSAFLTVTVLFGSSSSTFATSTDDDDEGGGDDAVTFDVVVANICGGGGVGDSVWGTVTPGIAAPEIPIFIIFNAPSILMKRRNVLTVGRLVTRQCAFGLPTRSITRFKNSNSWADVIPFGKLPTEEQDKKKGRIIRIAVNETDKELISCTSEGECLRWKMDDRGLTLVGAKEPLKIPGFDGKFIFYLKKMNVVAALSRPEGDSRTYLSVHSPNLTATAKYLAQTVAYEGQRVDSVAFHKRHQELITVGSSLSREMRGEDNVGDGKEEEEDGANETKKNQGGSIIRIWTVRSSTFSKQKYRISMRLSIDLRQSVVKTIGIDEAKDRIVGIVDNERACLWNYSTGKIVRCVHLLDSSLQNIAHLTSVGKQDLFYARSHTSDRLQIWNRDLAEVSLLKAHDADIVAMACCPAQNDDDDDDDLSVCTLDRNGVLCCWATKHEKRHASCVASVQVPLDEQLDSDATVEDVGLYFVASRGEKSRECHIFATIRGSIYMFNLHTRRSKSFLYDTPSVGISTKISNNRVSGSSSERVWAEDGDVLMTLSSSGSMHVAAAKSGRSLQNIQISAATANATPLCVVFDPSARCLLSGGGDGTVRMLHPLTGREIRKFRCARSQRRGSSRVVALCSVSCDPSIVIAGLCDGRAAIWNVKKRKVGKAIETRMHAADLLDLFMWQSDILDSSSHVVVSVSRRGEVKSWHLEAPSLRGSDAKMTLSLRGYFATSDYIDAAITCVTQVDATLLCLGFSDGSLQWWDIPWGSARVAARTASPTFRRRHDDECSKPVTSVSTTRNGMWMLSSGNFQATLWRTRPRPHKIYRFSLSVNPVQVLFVPSKAPSKKVMRKPVRCSALDAVSGESFPSDSARSSPPVWPSGGVISGAGEKTTDVCGICVCTRNATRVFEWPAICVGIFERFSQFATIACPIEADASIQRMEQRLLSFSVRQKDSRFADEISRDVKYDSCIDPSSTVVEGGDNASDSGAKKIWKLKQRDVGVALLPKSVLSGGSSSTTAATTTARTSKMERPGNHRPNTPLSAARLHLENILREDDVEDVSATEGPAVEPPDWTNIATMEDTLGAWLAFNGQRVGSAMTTTTRAESARASTSDRPVRSIVDDVRRKRASNILASNPGLVPRVKRMPRPKESVLNEDARSPRRIARPFYSDTTHCHGVGVPLGFFDRSLILRRVEGERELQRLRKVVAERHRLAEMRFERSTLRLPLIQKDEVGGILLLQIARDDKYQTLDANLEPPPAPSQVPGALSRTDDCDWMDSLAYSLTPKATYRRLATIQMLSLGCALIDEPSIDECDSATVQSEILAAAFIGEVRDLAKRDGVDVLRDDDFINLMGVNGLEPPTESSQTRPEDSKSRWKGFMSWYRRRNEARRDFVQDEMELVLEDDGVISAYVDSIQAETRTGLLRDAKRVDDRFASMDEESFGRWLRSGTAESKHFLKGSIDKSTAVNVQNRFELSNETLASTVASMTLNPAKSLTLVRLSLDDIKMQQQVENATNRRSNFLNWYLKSGRKNVAEDEGVRRVFLERHPTTASRRLFRPPSWGFYVSPETLSSTDRLLELKAALSDAIVRRSAMDDPVLRDTVMDMHPDHFDVRDRASSVRLLDRCCRFERWFYGPSLTRQLARFALLQRELKSLKLEASLMRSIAKSMGVFDRSKRGGGIHDIPYTSLARWYASHPLQRRTFLKMRVAQVQEYAEIVRHSWRIDLIIETSPDVLAATVAKLKMSKLFEQMPNIDIFAQKWLKTFVDFELSKRGVELFDMWANFVTRYHFEGERWWLTDTHALDPTDDCLLREREREARERDSMAQEEAYLQRLREEENRIELQNRRREMLGMKEEDLLAQMIRDNVMFFKFFGTMTSRSDVMDPPKLFKWGVGSHRYEKGLGVDNGDEVRERMMTLQARERDEMELEEAHMRRVMEYEFKRRQIELAKQRAELERLRRERMRDRLYAKVLQQRELDRQRREDPDGLTYEERREVDRRDMAAEDERSERVRADGIINEEREEEMRRLREKNVLAARERSAQDAIEREKRSIEAEKYRAKEREENECMKREDALSRALEAAIAHALAEREFFDAVIAPFEPFYPKSPDAKPLSFLLRRQLLEPHGNTTQTSTVTTGRRRLNNISECRTGQEWLAHVHDVPRRRRRTERRSKEDGESIRPAPSPRSVLREAMLKHPGRSLPNVRVSAKMKELIGLGSYRDRLLAKQCQERERPTANAEGHVGKDPHPPRPDPHRPRIAAARSTAVGGTSKGSNNAARGGPFAIRNLEWDDAKLGENASAHYVVAVAALGKGTREVDTFHQRSSWSAFRGALETWLSVQNEIEAESHTASIGLTRKNSAR